MIWQTTQWYRYALTAGMVLAAGAETPAGAAEQFISVRDNTGAVLGGTPLLDGDIVRYDPVADAASVYLAESAFESGSIDVNALHVFDQGRIAFSTLFNGGIGGVSFGDGDVVEYDPATGQASVLLPETAWTGSITSTDVNALFIRDDGTMLLSHNNDADTLGGVTFGDGDILSYDPVTDVGAVLVAETALFDDLDGDVDALHLLPSGNLLLSFAEDEIISGLGFADGDLVEYDPATDTASLYMGESTYASLGAANDTNAFSIATTVVPVPGALALLGLAGLVGRRRRR